MRKWIMKFFKNKEELIEEELNRKDFIQIYLNQSDQGKLFAKNCKIPNGNIFNNKQFKSWCKYMVAFTFEQTSYKLLVKNKITKKVIENAKKEIRVTALGVL